MKQILWGAARATTVEEFKREMEELEQANILSFQWLSANQTSEWSRSAIREGPKCDILFNDLDESFNATILSAREKSILTMLEQLRDYLKCRMVVTKWIQLVGPRILKIIEKDKALARLCHAKWAGGSTFQVTTSTQDQLVVNLSNGSCSCRRFQLIGIPCGHALHVYLPEITMSTIISTIFLQKEAYKKTYTPDIYLMPNLDRWPIVRQHVIFPHVFKKMPGRPKKIRKREPGEPPASNAPPTKVRKFNMVMHCRNCKQSGHYYTSCKEVTTITFHLTNHFFFIKKYLTNLYFVIAATS
ncbi:hypothetical protein UlMin_003478 [Ulmus minor]